MFAGSALADAPLLLNGQSFTNGCSVTNLGATAGSVNMVPTYQKMSSNTMFTGACIIDNLGTSSGSVNAIPLFERAQYTCAAGQYLPANAIECVSCLAGATCAGGTYSFNETSDQGVSCAGTIYAGACHTMCSVLTTLHAGTYTYPLFADKTNVSSPVLHIKDNNNNICYVYLEANTGGEHGFMVRYNNTIYHAIDPR